MSETPREGRCDYCHLPLAWSATADDDPQYCCVGCRLAAQIVGDDTATGLHQATLVRLAFAVFLSLNVMMFTMALWTQEAAAVDGAPPTPLQATLDDLFRYLCLVLGLPVLWLLGMPLLENGWAVSRRGAIATDLLILIGVAAAFVYSIVAVLRGAGHIYFEVGCVVLIMVTLGRWLEATGKIKTTAALEALERFLPARARVADDPETAAFTWLPLGEIDRGQLVVVEPGERIPLDGTIVAGQAHVDQQALTGESEPIGREPGERVFGGTTNVDGRLVIRVAARADEGVWGRLVKLVNAGRAREGHYQRLTERVARRFLPIVLAVAAVTFAAQWRLAGAETATMATLSVLLIACPCALGLATPMAVSAAFGAALEKRVLFQSGDALERLQGVRAVCFDKTGTLTLGTADVGDVLASPGERLDEVLGLAGAIAAGSSHPFSVAVSRHAKQTGANSSRARVDDVGAVPGRGLAGKRTDGAPVYLGSARWMAELGLRIPDLLCEPLQAAQAQGHGISLLAERGAIRAAFVFREQLRPEAAVALSSVRERGCHVVVLTGDTRQRGEQLERQLGVPVIAELLPEDKVAAVERFKREYGAVAMIGDGLNDAPALAASDLGIALGCGVDLARESADVCLLGNDLNTIPWAIDLSRRTVQIVRQNLFWAFAYNAGGMGLAACGWLNPGWASLAMVASSVLVIVNSLRLAPADGGGFAESKDIACDARDEAASTPAPFALQSQLVEAACP